MRRSCSALLALAMALWSASAHAQDDDDEEPIIIRKPPPGGTSGGPKPSESPKPSEAPLSADKGRISGVVVDAKTSEPVIEAQVSVVGTKWKTRTDVDGRYTLTLPAGSYELRVWYELYQARRISQIVVEAGQNVTVDVQLGSDQSAVQEVVVTARADSTSDAVQLLRRRRAATVGDAISAEQIARSPDSNASDAAKRIVAATVQDNRYIVIRGLGGRYSLALLNGVQLPSPDPDVPAAPLDLFPAALLANLNVAKSFSPDMPGNFAGGAISLESRSFPSKFTFKARIATSGDSQTTFRKGNTYQGGGLDLLGFDDGTRALPDAIPRKAIAFTGSAEDNTAQAQSFRNKWDLRKRTLEPNLGLGLTLGDTLKLGQGKLGYLASVGYSHAWQVRHRSLTKPYAGEGGRVVKDPFQVEDFTTKESVGLNGLLTMGWQPGGAHQLNTTIIYTNSTDDSASSTVGTDSNVMPIMRTRTQFLQRTMLAGQLIGEHALAKGKLVLAWQGNLARTSQHEPDTRDLQRVENNGVFVIGRSAGSAQRLFSDLTDVTGGGGLTATVSASSTIKLKAGGMVTASSRVYLTRRFSYTVSDALTALPTEEALSNAHVDAEVRLLEATQPMDGYQASRTTWAAFAMADVARFDPLRVIAGARFERSHLELEQELAIDPSAVTADPIDRSDDAILPAVNAVYAIGDKANVRAAYAITVARASFRELSSAIYYDYVRRRTYGGNPNLEETSIHNADLRYERFFGPTELAAASVFYKYFSQPIERTLEADNGGFANADSAQVYGVELEGRVGLGRIAPLLQLLSLGANFSYIHSAVETPGATRRLQGQSPYVINVDLGYDKPCWGTRLNVYYNVFGERIDEVGTQNLKDVLERPFHRVDLAASQSLPRGLRLKLGVTNVLNQRVVFTEGLQDAAGSVDILSYRPGIGFQASLELAID